MCHVLTKRQKSALVSVTKEMARAAGKGRLALRVCDRLAREYVERSIAVFDFGFKALCYVLMAGAAAMIQRHLAA